MKFLTSLFVFCVTQSTNWSQIATLQHFYVHLRSTFRALLLSYACILLQLNTKYFFLSLLPSENRLFRWKRLVSIHVDWNPSNTDERNHIINSLTSGIFDHYHFRQYISILTNRLLVFFFRQKTYIFRWNLFVCIGQPYIKGYISFENEILQNL